MQMCLCVVFNFLVRLMFMMCFSCLFLKAASAVGGFELTETQAKSFTAVLGLGAASVAGLVLSAVAPTLEAPSAPAATSSASKAAPVVKEAKPAAAPSNGKFAIPGVPAKIELPKLAPAAKPDAEAAKKPAAAPKKARPAGDAEARAQKAKEDAATAAAAKAEKAAAAQKVRRKRALLFIVHS